MRLDVSNVDMASLTLIARGGQGEVYEAPGGSIRLDTIGYSAKTVYKQYVRPLSTEEVEALDARQAFFWELKIEDKETLLNLAAWPCQLVERDGDVVGFTMPRIHDDFVGTFQGLQGQVREHICELQFLLNPNDYLVRIGLNIGDHQRFEFLETLAEALVSLHSLGVVVADLSPRNLLFSLDPVTRVYFLDCDSMALHSLGVDSEIETPGWRVQDLNPREKLGTTYSDAYKFGVVALRIFAGDQAVQDPSHIRGRVSGDLQRLVERSLSFNPTERPLPCEWLGAIREEKQSSAQASDPPKEPELQTRHLVPAVPDLQMGSSRTRGELSSLGILAVVAVVISSIYGAIFFALPVPGRFVMLFLLFVASAIVLRISFDKFAEERYCHFAAGISLAGLLLLHLLMYLWTINRSDDVLRWPEDAWMIIGLFISWVFIFAFWFYGFTRSDWHLCSGPTQASCTPFAHSESTLDRKSTWTGV